ncbi:MAG: hypothetical protein ACK4TA_22730 [Saprospiraceae bacterium]
MKQILHLLFIFNTLYSFAQNSAALSAGARGAGMANASVTLTDIHSIFSNQAGLAHLSQFTTTAFAEQRFLVKELQTVSAAAALPTPSGTFGVTVHHFGFEGFNEQKFGVAYARRLLDGLSIGAQFLLLNTSIPEYGNKMNVTFELGMLTQLLPQLQLGAHVYSPVQIELANGENLPTIFKIGLAYLPSEKLTCNLEVEKDIAFPARTKFGIEYQVVEQVQLRTGIATNPTTLAFGAGYRLNNGLALDVASSYHQLLGFTPTVGFLYVFKKK